MDAALIDIIEKIADTFIGRVNSNMREAGKNVTGETSRSLHYTIKDNGGGQPVIDMVGKPFFAVIETGRKPTPDKKPSAAMIENIEDWLSAKGKPAELSWAIATTINKEGTKLWQQGGRKDIYSNEIPVFVDAVANATTEYYANKLIESLNGLNDN